MSKYWLTGAAVAALIGVQAQGAVAQQPQAQQQPAAQQPMGQQPMGQQPMDQAPGGGLPSLGTTGPSGFPLSTGAGPVAFYTQGSDDHLVSNLLGAPVTNAQKENIGVVRDLVMSKLGDVKAAIIDVGEYMGGKPNMIAVNLVSLQMRYDRDRIHVVLAANREQLKMAPQFGGGGGLDAIVTGETPLGGANAPR